MSARLPLTVDNADTATFECTFGRGCPGVCCRNGRPSLSAPEQQRVRDHLSKFLPRLRPEARKMVEAGGFLSNRTKLGLPMLRVSAGWCVFFHDGCVLHAVGADEGDFAKYKPAQCVMFPLEPNGDGTWYVRQWGYNKERWDLFCLNPAQTQVKAVDSLAPEIAFLAQTAHAGLPTPAHGPGGAAPDGHFG